MKHIIFFFSFMIISNLVKAQILVRIEFSHVEKKHGGRMYYIMDNNVLESIKTVDTFSLENILKLWGTPILPNGYSFGTCIKEDTVLFNLYTLFDTFKSYKATCILGIFKVYLTFIRIDNLTYCKAEMSQGRHYWGDHNVKFPYCGTITLIPRIIKLTRTDQRALKKISLELKRLDR